MGYFKEGNGMRQDIINKVNRLSKASGTLNIDVLKMYDLIFNYCKKNKKNPSKRKKASR